MPFYLRRSLSLEIVFLEDEKCSFVSGIEKVRSFPGRSLWRERSNPLNSLFEQSVQLLTERSLRLFVGPHPTQPCTSVQRQELYFAPCEVQSYTHTTPAQRLVMGTINSLLDHLDHGGLSIMGTARSCSTIIEYTQASWFMTDHSTNLRDWVVR